jgi:hypothetical protein
MTRLRVLVTALLTLSALITPNAHAATTGNLTKLYFSSDWFWNYDFTSQSVSSSGVDWDVQLLFWNNARINSVKNNPALSDYYAYGGAKYARMNDGAGAVWDQDDGPKTAWAGCVNDTRHFRIYADGPGVGGDDRLYSTGVGYWVFATTHKDFDEKCNSHYGDGEMTERDVGKKFNQYWYGCCGYTVNFDYAYFYNYEGNCYDYSDCPGRIDSSNPNHRWQTNGYATYIRIP